MNAKVAVLVVLSGLAIAFGSYLVFQNPTWSGANANTVVATTSQTIMNAINGAQPNEEAVIAKWFAPLTSFTLGRISLQASVADTEAEREQGLSDTPYIPAGIAKLFIFDSAQQWSFWMKDMKYAIDIFWLDENGHVVHIVESVTPDTYPNTSFAPPVPAKYVIETKAGFAKENNIRVGEVAGMTQILMERQ